MEQRELTVAMRSESGSSAARRLRRTGVVPAVMYGRGMAPMALAVDAKSLRELLHAGGHNVIVRLNLEGGGEAPTVMLKEIQRDAIGGGVLNVDFQRISLTEKVTAQVPVVLVGESPGVKLGGVLDHVLREVEVECLPTQIPVNLALDISSLVVGHSLHVSDLAPPAEVVIANEPSDVIVTLSRMVEEVVAAPAAAVAAEGEEGAGEAEAEGEAAEEE